MFNLQENKQKDSVGEKRSVSKKLIVDLVIYQ